MQVSNPNNVQVYSVSSASKSAIPDWLAKKNQKALKGDQDYRRRIELIQDFEFPEASTRLKASRDGKFLLATGVYQPRMRVYDLSQLSMKFERHFDAENVQFEILSDDWTKTVLLQSDRSIEFHSHYGLHYKTRVPKFGRDLAFHYPTCDLMVAGASSDVWRLNLEQGRFMNPLTTDMPEINVVSINPANQLFGFGGMDGQIEFWHPRERRRIGQLDVGGLLERSIDSELLRGVPEITSLEFAQDGLQFSVGTSSGHVVLYDLRRPTPLLIKDHQYGFPIKNITFHSSGRVISSDTKIVKIWDQLTGDAFTSIEPPNDINDVCVGKDSGLIMIANEGIPIQSYYIPSLGPAPKWCPFLDNLTEELEENPTQTIYDDYKFVTRKELEVLQLSHLIGTNVLRAYMHGFFIDLRLYEKAKAIVNPFQFEEYRKRRIASKLEEKRASRISAQKKLPKVNAQLAMTKMDDMESKTQSKKSKKRGQTTWENVTAENPLGDSRFMDLFKDEEFQVDETSHEYKIHHPTESRNKTLLKQFEKVDSSKDEDDESDASFSSENDKDSLMSDIFGQSEEDEEEDDSDEDNAIRFHRQKSGLSKPKSLHKTSSQPIKSQKTKKTLHQIKEGASVFSSSETTTPLSMKTFGERLTATVVDEKNGRKEGRGIERNNSGHRTRRGKGFRRK